MDFCDGFSYLWSQISQHTSSYCHHHLCIIKEGFLPKQNILMGVEHCKCVYEMYDTTMRAGFIKGLCDDEDNVVMMIVTMMVMLVMRMMAVLTTQ